MSCDAAKVIEYFDENNNNNNLKQLSALNVADEAQKHTWNAEFEIKTNVERKYKTKRDSPMQNRRTKNVAVDGYHFNAFIQSNGNWFASFLLFERISSTLTANNNDHSILQIRRK